MIRGFFADHQGGAVEIAVGDLRHDGGVSDAQVFDTDDAAFGVYHSCGVMGCAHFASAGGVIGAFAVLADEVVDVSIRLNCATGLDFFGAERLKRFLRNDLTGVPDAGAKLRPVIGM